MELRHNNTERLTVRRPRASFIVKSTVRVGGWGSHDANRLFFESTVVRSGISTTARFSSPRHLSLLSPAKSTRRRYSHASREILWILPRCSVVTGPPRPCRLRQLQRAFSAATNTNFRNHFSDKRQRAGWHRNAEFHRYSHE